MPAPASPHDWTVDMLDSLPDDGRRYEIIDGELVVTPAPNMAHQAVLGELYALLRGYLRDSRVGRPFLAPSDVRSGPRRFVQPDLFVVGYDALKAGRYPFAIADLLLAVEVSSPATARRDWSDKRTLYLREGVPEYWIVDVDARSVARWLTGEHRPEILLEQLVWHPRQLPAPLTIDLSELFRAALDFE